MRSWSLTEHAPAPAPLVGKAMNSSGELLCDLHCGRVFSWDIVLGGHLSPFCFFGDGTYNKDYFASLVGKEEKVICLV